MARIRAWVLGNVGLEAKKGLGQLYQDNKVYKAGEEEYVVIRVDLVNDFNIDGESCNIIIPIDAEDGKGLKKAEQLIKEILNINIIKTVIVESHIPDPPHLSHGFITDEEIIKEKDVTKWESSQKRGRQRRRSPGSNKWG